MLCSISINLLIAFDRGELATTYSEIKPKTLHCVLRYGPVKMAFSNLIMTDVFVMLTL